MDGRWGSLKADSVLVRNSCLVAVAAAIFGAIDRLLPPADLSVESGLLCAKIWVALVIWRCRSI